MIFQGFRVAEPWVEACKRAAERDDVSVSDIYREGIRLALIERQKRYERREQPA